MSVVFSRLESSGLIGGHRISTQTIQNQNSQILAKVQAIQSRDLDNAGQDYILQRFLRDAEAVTIAESESNRLSERDPHEAWRSNTAASDYTRNEEDNMIGTAS